MYMCRFVFVCIYVYMYMCVYISIGVCICAYGFKYNCERACVPRTVGVHMRVRVSERRTHAIRVCA